MQPGFRAPLLIGFVLAALLPGRAGAQEKKPELRHLPPGAYAITPPIPTISCNVSAGEVATGQRVEVTTRVVRGDAAGLKYSFETSAGRLTAASANASTARLDTTGVAAGEISVTCIVVDAYGRKVSYGKVIRLRGGNVEGEALPSQHLPTAAPPDTQEKSHATPPPPPPPGPVGAPGPVARPPTEAPKPQPPKRATTAVPGKANVPAGTTPADGSKTAANPESNEYAEGLAIQRWENELKTGKIEYNLPTKMSLPAATSVSVVVHGYEDVSGPVPPGVQSAALKVSQRMRVTLSAEGNPGEFMIEPDGTDDVQLVPIDGTARWQWKVTPKEPAKDQKLTIRALLVYPNDPNKADVEITSYTVEVSVQVGSLWEWIKYLFWNDPVGLLKYLLPGGAGFAFVAGLVMWWWRRRHPEKKMATKG